jgi:hypothetical protein
MDEVLHLALLPHANAHPADKPENTPAPSGRKSRTVAADLR